MGEPQHLRRGQQVGRYLILSSLGMGGVAVVYAAYDPELDRKVAVKLLRADAVSESARIRLVREAQAIARLAHPNVVAVFDAGTWEGQVFLAMELVDGGSLADWRVERPRSWREIRDAFMQAGRGLAAAHAAGLVHRDIKPSNILIGRDDRVRVGDFGLARPALDAPDDHDDRSPEDDVDADRISQSATIPARETSASSDGCAATVNQGDAAGVILQPGARHGALQLSVTKTGTLLGTPAYMAPEQHQRRPADARSDQFGYCVALYESLYGQSPFEPPADSSLPGMMALAAEVLAGRVREPPAATRVPAWVLQVIRRGLAVAPDDRYPSMDRLLDDLGRDPGGARRPAITALAATGAIAVAAFAMWGRGGTAEPGCERAAAGLDRAWTATRRAALTARLGAVAVGVVNALDGYAADWKRMRIDTCAATRHGVQSATLLDLRTQCLDVRLTELATATELLASGVSASPEQARRLVDGLRPIAACADLTSLTTIMPPPADPAARARLERLAVLYTQANDHGARADFEPAIRVAEEAVAEARALAHPPALAEALFQLGREQRGAGRPEAEQTLLAAAHAADEARDDLLRARTWNLLAVLIGIDRGDPAAGLRHAATARAALDRHGEAPVEEARLLHTQGLLQAAAGEADGAVRSLREALARRESVHGSDSFEVAQTLTDLGSTLSGAGQLEEAIAIEERAVTVLERHPDRGGNVLPALLNNLGAAHYRAGHVDAADTYFRRSLALREQMLAPDHPSLAFPLFNIAELARERGDCAGAVPGYVRALALWEPRGADYPMLVKVRSRLALCYVEMGEGDRALRLAEAALAQVERLALTGIDRGVARFAVARARWETGADRGRSLGLARDAASDLRGVGEPASADLAAVEAWLAAPTRR